MPTNISRPIWCCDICSERFGENQAAAQRCESAGQPAEMPAGTLLLGHDLRGSASGFALRHLYRVPHKIGTLAATHHLRTGHTLTYAVDVDPARYWDGDRGYFRWPNPAQPVMLDSGHLTPYLPGVLQHITDRSIGVHSGVDDYADPAWILDLFGLNRNAINPNRGSGNTFWTRPLTPEVKAVLDALSAFPRFLQDDPERRRLIDREWTVADQLGNLAVGVAGGGTRDRAGNTRRARWYLMGADEDAMVAGINAMWRQWRGGSGKLVDHEWDVCELGQDDVPSPRLISKHDHLTASKLTRELRALVAATGAEWPARTNATAYCNLLVDKTLEFRMQTDRTLFAGVRVIATLGRKGGVGKSTVAAALARRLAQNGHRVVLVDFDLAGPSQHIIHKLGPVPTDVERTMILPSGTDVVGLKVFSPGQVFGADAKTQWSDTAGGQWIDFIGSSLDLGGADLVVLDMPPGESGLHAHLIGDRARTDVEVHVTTGHPLALADTERDLATRSGRRYLVENLSRVRGTIGLGHEVEVRLHGLSEDAPALAGRTGTEWAGSLPWVDSVAELADSDEVRLLAEAIAPALADAVPAEPASGGGS